MCIPILAVWGASILGTTGTTAAASFAAYAAGTAAAASIASGVVGAYGSLQQGKFQSKIAKNNAIIEKQKRDDAIERGKTEEQNYRRQIAGIKGEQRAAMAANNVSLDSDTSMGIIEDTAQVGEMDALTIRANAAREGWGYDVSATNALASSKMHKQAGRLNAAGTVLSTASSVGSMWKK